MILSRSYWKCTSDLQKHIIFVCLYALLSCMLCFHACFAFMCAHIYAFIWCQTFEKWHNVSYRYISYRNSETFNIWRTGAWFLKPFGERVNKKHIYHLVIPNSAVKTRTAYRGCKVCYQVFLENGKIEFKSKIWHFYINLQT